MPSERHVERELKEMSELGIEDRRKEASVEIKDEGS